MAASDNTVNRRSFLQLLGAGAAVGSIACRDSVTEPADLVIDPRTVEPSTSWPGAVSPSGEAFPHAGTGDARPDAVWFAGRIVVDGEVDLHVARWTGTTWEEPTVTPLTVAEGGYVATDLTGLEADTWYAWQLTSGTNASAVGRFVTPAAEDHNGDVTLAFTSCLDQDHLAFPSLRHTVERGPLDAFYFLGDTAYFDAERNRDEFRALYTRNLSAEGIRDAMLGASTVFIYDDHEFRNDFHSENISPERFELGMSSWQESLPFRPDPEHPNRTWRSFRYGSTVEVFVIDTRSERVPSMDRMLSIEQMTWLKRGLATSPAVWKVVATPVPFTDYTDTTWDVEPLRADRWSGYLEQQRELLNSIGDEALTGVFFVGGDVHCTYLGRVAAEGPGARIWELLGGPGGSFLNPVVRTLRDSERFAFGADVWNAVRVRFSSKGTAIIEVVDEAGDEFARFEIADNGDLLSSEALDPSVFGTPRS